ncbi:MAG TPA: CPBP family intramembrane glutamic endopeptidase [Actinomycetota bacterium]|nr:CPBP family intramembrane glutamic endopeptidase [Actinomycetota bacterium]
MTLDAVRAGTPRAASPTHVSAGLTLLAGSAALLSRPVSDAFIPITVVVAIAGSLHPLPNHYRFRDDRRTWLAVVGLGIAAFAVARGALGGSLIPPPTTWLLVSVTVAAVAEELFFRRFMFGVLAGRGIPLAIALSSAAFALVHVTLWGWRAVPVDLAAGALLGWQRWVTGSWTAPAVTHAAANILMLL